MPQMSPMWWTSLEIMFSVSFILMIVIMYFNKKESFKLNTKKNKNYFKWMW